jgi:hypothetical protein
MAKRFMETSDDMLFRIAKYYKGKLWGYQGPYTDVAVARRILTKERNDIKRYRRPEEHDDYAFELEACIPEWKVVER